MQQPSRPGPNHRPRRSSAGPALCILMLAVLATVSGSGTAAAQSVVGEPTDLTFRFRDATTGQPAVAERLTLEYVSGRLNTILDTAPGGAEFMAAAVPVKDIGQYIVTAWYRGVPYWWQKRGTDLTSGPVQLDVFGVTENLEAVTITGLNLVVRNRETTAELEYMVEIANLAQPQTTVSRGSGTFALQLPAGATNLEATYTRGPEPTPVPVTLAGSTASLAMPLTPGANRLRLTARVPWNGALDLPVGSDLPVNAWSLLTSPPQVSVEGGEMQAPDEQSVPGFVRRAGPPLAGGRTFSLRLLSGTRAGEPESLFTTSTPADGQAAADVAAAQDGKGGGFPVPLAVLFVLIIIGALVFARRRRS